MDFHTKNTERIELAQALTKKNAAGSGIDKDSSSAVSGNGVTMPVIKNDKSERSPSLAPVEIAVPKMNEKYLSKEELRELRKQLRQQN